jgi:hypothetical protein
LAVFKKTILCRITFFCKNNDSLNKKLPFFREFLGRKYFLNHNSDPWLGSSFSLSCLSSTELPDEHHQMKNTQMKKARLMVANL